MPLADILYQRAARKIAEDAGAARILEAKGPLLRAEVERRINARTQGDKPAPISPNYLDQLPPRSSSEALQAPSSTGGGTTLEAPRGDGPVEAQPQLQQQQRIFGGPTALSRRGNEGDTQAQGIMDDIDAIEEPNNQARMNDDAVGYRSYNQYGRAAADYDERNVFIAPADRLPRFEIDDTPSRINPRYLQSIRTSAPAKEISGGGIQVLPLGDKNLANLKLGDIFDHPELYRYYPEARNIKIGRIPSTDKSNKIASFNNKENKLKLRTFSTDEESLRSTIIHELQHFVQKEEGFARGGSPDEFLRPHLKGFDSFEDKVKLADRKVEIYQNRLAIDPNDTNVQALLARAKAERDMLDDALNEAYDDYYRLTGEKEARDAQNRLAMSPIERALNLPALADREAMEGAITLGQNQSITGNIVPGMSYEAGHIVFHGGPVSAIEKFLLKFIGTGEGAVFRGWGFYFADRPGISARYREARQTNSEKPSVKSSARLPDMVSAELFAQRHGKGRVEMAKLLGIDASKMDGADIEPVNLVFFDLDERINMDFMLDWYNTIELDYTFPKRKILEGIITSIRQFIKDDIHDTTKVIKQYEADLDLKVKEGYGQEPTAEDLNETFWIGSRLQSSRDRLNVLQTTLSHIRKNSGLHRHYLGVIQDAWDRFKNLPDTVPLSDEPGLFVLDLKANEKTDYIHLDQEVFGNWQSTKVQKIIDSMFNDLNNVDEIYTRNGNGTMADGTGEDLIEYFEDELWDALSHKDPWDLKDAIAYQSKFFTPKLLEAAKRAYRTTLDTTDMSNPWLVDKMNRKFASLVLKEMGIPGSAHWDSQSRSYNMPDKDRTNNYVIWDEDIIEQLAVQPYSWAGRGKLEVDPTDHPPTDEYTPN